MLVLFIGLGLISSVSVAYFSDVERSPGNLMAAAEQQQRCAYLGKIEFDDEAGTFKVEDDDPNDGNLGENTFYLAPNDESGDWVVLKVTPTELKDEEEEEVEVLAVDFEVLDGSPICTASVKAAQETELYEFDCVYSGENIRTPSYYDTPAKAISHITFWYCQYYYEDSGL